MIEHLQISLPKGRSVEARLMRRAGRELAILLPGLNYNNDMPLLYYATEHLYERNIDTLRVDFTYNRDADFLREADEKQLEWLKDDGRSVMDFALNIGNYDRVTIIGKSVGTISMGWAIPDILPNARLVWLTSSLRDTGLMEQMLDRLNPSFCLIGTRDPSFNEALPDELAVSGITMAVVDGANHGFSHKDGVAASVGVVHNAVEALACWLDTTA